MYTSEASTSGSLNLAIWHMLLYIHNFCLQANLATIKLVSLLTRSKLFDTVLPWKSTSEIVITKHNFLGHYLKYKSYKLKKRRELCLKMFLIGNVRWLLIFIYIVDSQNSQKNSGPRNIFFYCVVLSVSFKEKPLDLQLVPYLFSQFYRSYNYQCQICLLIIIICSVFTCDHNHYC